jgi:protein ImuA
MISPQSLPRPSLAPLRARIRRLERAGRLESSTSEHGALAFGVAAIDAHLPEGGLALGRLHEILGSGGPEIGATTLFAASLLARLKGPVLWCHGGQGLFPGLFPPGLAGVGLSPDRVIHVAAGEQKTVLLAMEEGLRQPGLAGVIGEISSLPMLASRRLALAAAASGTLALALGCPTGKKPEGEEHAPTAAATRWRVRPLPSADIADPALWRLELLRCRGAEPAAWLVEAPDAAGRLDLAAVLRSRSSAPLERSARAASK